MLSPPLLPHELVPACCRPDTRELEARPEAAPVAVCRLRPALRLSEVIFVWSCLAKCIQPCPRFHCLRNS